MGSIFHACTSTAAAQSALLHFISLRTSAIQKNANFSHMPNKIWSLVLDFFVLFYFTAANGKNYWNF
jgi:hypothetical protein